MPDWRAYVQEHLGLVSDLQASQKEIVSELAGHLEERYEALLASGIPQVEAERLTWETIGSWEDLRNEILFAKEGFVQNRVTQLWIPGLVTFVGSAGLLVFLEYEGVRPLVFHSSGRSPMSHPYDSSAIVLNVPWLVSLLVIGALGAFLSRRARATGLATHISSAFPALIMAVVIALVFAGGLFLGWSVSQQVKELGLLAAGFNMVVMPGVALLAGDLLLQWALRRHTTSL
jgi:hypothetical protein